MSQLIPFSFDGAAVRIVQIEGEPWFVGKDVCEALGYTNPAKAMADHCRDDGVTKRYPIIDSLGRTQEARVLNEANVLRLIINSRLPAAERFEAWVFEEVLPSIRRTGGYGKPIDPMQVLADPAAVRGLLLTYTERVIALEGEVAAQAPKVAAHERLLETDGSFSLREAAKACDIPERQFIGKLQAACWIYRHQGGCWLGYSDKIKAGMVTHKVVEVRRLDGSEKVVERVRITAKGLAKLAEMFCAIAH